MIYIYRFAYHFNYIDIINESIFEKKTNLIIMFIEILIKNF